MDKNILLTYKHVKGYFTFEWFETVEEARCFSANSLEIDKIVECYDCSTVKEVIL